MAYRSAYPWYDSLWLDAYRKARGILAEVRPDLRGDFEEALAVLRVPADFRVREVPDLLDPESLAALTEVVLGLHLRDLAAGEAVAFGRLITHDHPVTRDIQQQLLGLAGELAGEELVPSYTFVSLYNGRGICRPHLDAPAAKWTLDLCVRQSEPWPIHISQPVPWPVDLELPAEGWEPRILRDPTLCFEPYVLQPGGAIFFGGSGQWHHRDPHPGTGESYCDLVFLHFIPAGAEELVRPEAWAELFGVPELAGLFYGDQRAG